MSSGSKCLVFYSRNKEENDITFKFAKDFFKSDQYFTISDYPTCDFYIDLNKYEICDLTANDWQIVEECIDFAGIIIKDRLLRNIEFLKAKELILKVAKSSIEILSKNSFKYLIVHPVDNYVMDVLIGIAKFYKCIVSGISSFFMGGYKRVTVYGEFNDFRKVSNEEVVTLKKKLTGDFRSHMAISKRKAIFRGVLYYFKYKIKYIIFYLIRHKLFGDYKYDYASTPYSATIDKFGKLFPFSFFRNNIAITEKSIYIPMHYHPEATIEYWSDDIKNVDYITSLIEAVRYFSDNGWSVYLKEHPAMCFRQDINLYKKINSIKNVVILDPFIKTSDVMKTFDNFLVWTGSTGIEALVNGKNVYFASSNYYYDKTTSHKYEKVCLEKEDDKDNLIRKVLSNTVRWTND